MVGSYKKAGLYNVCREPFDRAPSQCKTLTLQAGRDVVSVADNVCRMLSANVPNFAMMSQCAHPAAGHWLEGPHQEARPAVSATGAWQIARVAHQIV